MLWVRVGFDILRIAHSTLLHTVRESLSMSGSMCTIGSTYLPPDRDLITRFCSIQLGMDVGHPWLAYTHPRAYGVGCTSYNIVAVHIYYI